MRYYKCYKCACSWTLDINGDYYDTRGLSWDDPYDRELCGDCEYDLENKQTFRIQLLKTLNSLVTAINCDDDVVEEESDDCTKDLEDKQQYRAELLATLNSLVTAFNSFKTKMNSLNT